MSAHRRPWYPWYPRDFNQDEKVRMLSDDAELIYRRALDVLWQASDLQMPSNCLKLANALARGWSTERFKNAWNEIQFEGYELLKTTADGKWVYSKRLKHEAEKIEKLCKSRMKAGFYTTTDTNEARILVRGIVRNEGWTGLTPGGAVYLSETAGGITQTAPSDSGDCVQIVGWALSDSEIYFDFSRPYLEVE